LDSLAVVPVLPAGSLLDAGSGAGFPGIPAAIAKPELDVALVDSVQKKVAFLKSALAELRLPRVRACAVRLEGNPSKEGLPWEHGCGSCGWRLAMQLRSRHTGSSRTVAPVCRRASWIVCQAVRARRWTRCAAIRSCGPWQTAAIGFPA